VLAKKKEGKEMTILKHRTLMIVVFVFLFFSLGTEAALAEVTYVGEFCFNVIPVPCPVGAPCVPIGLQLGVLSYGDNHYVINGIYANSPVYGTGFIQDNTATVSLSNTTAANFSAIYIVLDLNTMTGTFSVMPIFPVLTPPATSGSLTGVACQ
jgi:hypothetical protein